MVKLVVKLQVFQKLTLIGFNSSEDAIGHVINQGTTYNHQTNDLIAKKTDKKLCAIKVAITRRLAITRYYK